MRNILGFLVIVVAFCGLESAINDNEEHDLCTSLCSRLPNDFPEENPKSFDINQIMQDSLMEKCDCNNFLKDVKRKRRSVATSSNPQPTTAIRNKTIVQQQNVTDNKKNDIPGYSVTKSIMFVKPSPYCNYSVEEKYFKKKGELLESVDVAFENHVPASFNVTWVPPKLDLDENVTDYLVVWNGQRKPNEIPDVKYSYIHCKLVPKNQTFTVIEENKDAGWEYPQNLYLAVLTVPQNIYGHSFPLKVFSPFENPKMIPVPPKHRGKDASLQTGSIAGGVAAGVLFIAVLFVLLYRKKCGHSESPDNEIGLIVPFANNSDGLPKVMNDSKPKNVDIYFGSYLPESEKYANEVATIASMLRANGYRVVFDQVDSVELNSMGFNLWVEKQILEAKKYIVFCSSGYVKLWQTLATNAQDDKLNHINKEDLVRVRYEIKRITDIYSESCSTSKIICIQMDQKMSTKSLPPWMNHNMLAWPEQKFDIIRRLNDQAAMIMDL